MAFFKRIHNAVQALFAEPIVINTVQNNIQVQDLGEVPTLAGKPRNTSVENLSGWITSDDLGTMHSSGLRNSIIFRQAGSSMAHTFGAFKALESAKFRTTDHERNFRNARQQLLSVIADAATYQVKISTEPDDLLFLKLMGIPAKMQQQDAAQIAEITGESINTLLKDNEARRKAIYAANEQHLQSFLNDIEAHWHACDHDNERNWPPARYTAKAVVGAVGSQLKFVMGWNDPKAKATEVLLIRTDHAILERRMAINDAHDQGAGDNSREIDDALLSSNEMAQGALAGK